MNLDAWTLEHRLVGWRILGLPLLTAAFLAGVALLTTVLGASDEATTILTGSLELGLPLAAAAVAASLVGVDPARELQLSLPAPYRDTIVRRAALATVWPALTAVVSSVALIAVGRWIAPGNDLGGQLVWIATLAWTSTVACVLTLLTRSHVAAVAVVATLAAAEAVLGDVFVRYAWLHPIYLLATTRTEAHAFWWSNRLALLATAVLAAGVTWLLLGRPERLLGEDD